MPKSLKLPDDAPDFASIKATEPLASRAEVGRVVIGSVGSSVTPGAVRHFLVSIPPSRFAFKERSHVLRVLLRFAVTRYLCTKFFNLFRLIGNFCLGFGVCHGFGR